jgi:hypothetical protein
MVKKPAPARPRLHSTTTAQKVRSTTAKSPVTAWYDSRPGALVLALVTGVLAWLLALYALDTARMAAYFGLIVLVIFAANRVVRAIRGR